MGLLAGKRILITGLLSNRSIAYGIAKAMQREGAKLAFTYQGEGVRERVTKIVTEFDSDLLFPVRCFRVTLKLPVVSTTWESIGMVLTGSFIRSLSHRVRH